jgi:hypothetical protein
MCSGRGISGEGRWQKLSVGDLYLHTKHAVSQAFVSEIRVARETTQCLSATLGARASWAMCSARDDASGMRVVRALRDLRGDAARVRASEVSERGERASAKWVSEIARMLARRAAASVVCERPAVHRSLGGFFGSSAAPGILSD